MMSVNTIVHENAKRLKALAEKRDPETGQGSIYEREPIRITDFYLPLQWVTKPIAADPLIMAIAKHKSIKRFVERELGVVCTKEIYEDIFRRIIKIRIKDDFEYWAVSFVKIKDKESPNYIPFRLRRAQQRLLRKLEDRRRAGKPIRLILLKARQWGGSTLVQMYMAWIQLVHRNNWNSIIVAHVKDTSAEIKGMYSSLLANYPPWLLGSESPIQFSPFEGSHSISIISQTGCKVKLGTAERPNSSRGGDSSMAHMTEVAFWKKTDNMSPDDIVRSVISGIANIPYTLQVYESTANGTGNFFHNEWTRAKKGESDKDYIFVPWFEIEMYSKPLNKYDYPTLIRSFTPYERWLFEEKGATLENIAWYREKRKEYTCDEDMMQEFPSDDIEAFKHSGSRVFDAYQVAKLRKGCKNPVYIGEVYGQATRDKAAIDDVKFIEEENGKLKIWALPDKSERISNRYLVIVDVGGRGNKSDLSVICVIDRYWRMYAGKEQVVAQWRGHIDHDLLAWKAAQIAKYYNNALLVFESNTYETESTDGDHTEYILSELASAYNNMYSRTPADLIRQGIPIKYGFHTNVSSKSAIIDNFTLVLREELYDEMDKEATEEMDTYQKNQKGQFEAIDGKHDDMLITRMIGMFISMKEMPLPAEIKESGPRKRAVGTEATI